MTSSICQVVLSLNYFPAAVVIMAVTVFSWVAMVMLFVLPTVFLVMLGVFFVMHRAMMQVARVLLITVKEI